MKNNTNATSRNLIADLAKMEKQMAALRHAARQLIASADKHLRDAALAEVFPEVDVQMLNQVDRLANRVSNFCK